MSNNKSTKTGLLDKAMGIKDLVVLTNVELDELIAALKDPNILHKEFTGRRKEIEDKLHNAVQMLVEIKRSMKE